MKKFIAIILIILVSSCKETSDSKNKMVSNKINKVSQVDYHKIMDVVLDTFRIQHDKIIHLEYEPSEQAIDPDYRKYILENPRLEENEKKLAIALLETGKDSFDFERSKLNRHSLRILKNSDKTTDKNLTYYFNSFLSNKEKDMVVSTVGAIMNNESHSQKNSGVELIMFFKKDTDDQWELSNFISTIEY